MRCLIRRRPPLLPAPNPWRDPGHDLDRSVNGGEILEGLTRIIEEWPREKTAAKLEEARHLRFILAVAGYPEIDVSTRPFDWPIHERSLKALEVSRMLDDVEGASKDTSLRSSLLNRDMNWRWQGKRKKELKNMHNQCLELLFKQLRKLDGEGPDDRYRWQEEALLGALHGYDNNRIHAWWPKMDLLDGCESLFDIQQDGDFVELEFQFHQIQGWLNKMVPGFDELEGTKQRWLRGASLLLEAVNSEARQRIAALTGIGSIIIDGGGRVTWISPQSLKDKCEEEIWISLKQFLHLSKSTARNSIRFESTLLNWSSRNIESGDFNPEVSDDDRERSTSGWVTADYDFWFDQFVGLMPPCSLAEKTTHDSERPLIERIQSYPRPIIRVISECEECWFCGTADFFEGCEDTAEKGRAKAETEALAAGKPWTAADNKEAFGESMAKARKKKAFSIDSYIGMSGSKKSRASESKICSLHRLLYLLGHEQRVKDSSIRLPIGQESSHMRYPKGRDRKVLAIAMLDANSVGVLFRERCQEDLSKTELLDRKRRRSFRFNATWWGAFGGSLDDVSRGDRVATWVAAGDDVILAEYGQVSNPQGGRPAEYPELVIEDVLERLATNLREEFYEFESGLFLSYSAGLAITRGERIGALLKSSLRREKSAKNRWKTGMKGSKMLETEDGIREPERQEEPDDSDWIGDTKSIVVKGDTVADNSEGGEVEEFSTEFHDWDKNLIQEICKHYHSYLGDSPDDDDVFKILKRHHIKECDGAKTLCVLVPKLKSKS